MKPLQKLFTQTHILPTMPRIVSELVSSLQDANTDLDDFIEKLRLDQVLTAKVLRLANSAHYGLSRKIGSIHEAIALIGFDQLRTLIIACGMAGIFTKVPHIELDSFWRANLLTALIGQDIAHQAKAPEDLVFTAALLSGIGILLIHLAYPNQGKIITQKTLGECLLARRSLELDLIGIDYCSVSAALAKRWNFPESIVQSVAYQAEPEHPDASPYARIVWQAIWLNFLISSEKSALIAGDRLLPAPSWEELRIDGNNPAEQCARYEALADDISSIL